MEQPPFPHDPFSLQGRTILITGAGSGHGQETAERCARMGARVVTLEQTESSAALPDTPFDGVVHCRPQTQMARLREMDSARMTEVVATRLVVPVALTLQLVRHGQLRADGSIVFETAQWLPSAAQEGACFSVEGGLRSLRASLALEYAQYRIRVNDIVTAEPAPADAALRLRGAEDFAHAAIYLLAPASRWVTGSTLVLTGRATL